MTEKKTAVILEGIAHLYTIYILPLTLLILNQLDSCYHCFYTFPCKDKIGWSFCISRGCPSQGLTHAEVPFSFPSSQILPATPPQKFRICTEPPKNPDYHHYPLAQDHWERGATASTLTTAAKQK